MLGEKIQTKDALAELLITHLYEWFATRQHSLKAPAKKARHDGRHRPGRRRF